jgi:hypothetical protein
MEMAGSPADVSANRSGWILWSNGVLVPPPVGVEALTEVALVVVQITRPVARQDRRALRKITGEHAEAAQ